MTDIELNKHSGFVAVLGRPNVGKSTLLNALLSQKIAAVSSRPQTTRKRQMGILTLKQDDQLYQAVFVDTPGIHKPHHKLGEYMNREAKKSMEVCDIILFVVDASHEPNNDDKQLFELFTDINRNIPIILALNKVDLTDPTTLELHKNSFLLGIPRAIPMPISATRGDHLDSLQKEIILRLPEGLPFFPEDQITDLYEREISADLIREACLNNLRDEIPHGIAIRIDQYTERGDLGAYIEATVFVERESHKSIVIGQGGKMIKRIGTTAREEIELVTGRKVYLHLKVKIRRNWRNDDNILQRFGY